MRRVLGLSLLFLVIFMLGHPKSSQASFINEEGNCRFGITSPQGGNIDAISSLGVGGYLDWRYVSPVSLPPGVDYIRMLRVSDLGERFLKVKEDLASVVTEHPGSYFIVGNEPDTIYEDQDGMTPEIYAERFFELAVIIRELDPTAKIGFGTIVQPTPIRLRYLDRTWNHLAELAGSKNEASRLIDFWSIHSFILNEVPGEWGVGVPLGFEDDHDDVVRISDFDDTHSIEIFKSRVRDFRAWMFEKGERNKPLWISEYGSLLPPEDPPAGSNYVNVTDAETKEFMIETFDFLLSESDPRIGMPADQYHLVQRWFWYSLNDFRYKFGGTLFDPITRKWTVVGDAFVEYVSNVVSGPDLFFMRANVVPTVPWRRIRSSDYRIDFLVANTGFYDISRGVISIYQGEEPVGHPLASVDFGPVRGCGEETYVVSVWLNNLFPKDDGLFTAKMDVEGDLDTINNVKRFYIHGQPYR